MISLLVALTLGGDSIPFPPEVRRLSVYMPPRGSQAFGGCFGIADVDDDGINDLMIGASFASLDPPAYEAGVVYYARGPALEIERVVDENPPERYHYFGGLVDAADMDGDGHADLAVSWQFGGEVRRGPEFIDVIGKVRGGGSAADNEHLRFLDVDRDGFADVVDAALSSPRRVYVYYGPDMSRQLKIVPAQPDRSFFPYSVAVGDVDGDGHQDIVAGSPGSEDGTIIGAGCLWCFFGPDFTRSLLVEDPTPLEAGFFAFSVAVGDYNHDGFGDIAACSRAEMCPEAYRCGETIVFFGPDLVTSRRFPDPPDGRTERSMTQRVGTAELDGDGIDDLLIATVEEHVNGYDDVGSVYIFHGPDFGWREMVVPVNATADDVYSKYGWALRVGDFTGDGLDDLAVGAPLRNLYGYGQAGVAHVYDFSTRFPFRSYGEHGGHRPRLRGEGDGGPDGSSRLVVDDLRGGAAILVLGERAASELLGSNGGTKGDGREYLLVSAQAYLSLGSPTGSLEYELRLPRDPVLAQDLMRIRFQVLEFRGELLGGSNGVVWTVRW